MPVRLFCSWGVVLMFILELWTSWAPRAESRQEDCSLMILHFALIVYFLQKGLPRWLRNKESACNAGDSSSIPGLGRSPGEANSNPLQYTCLENPVDGGA